jgi:aspartate/methionine/tyrosine aminotransferase
MGNWTLVILPEAYRVALPFYLTKLLIRTGLARRLPSVQRLAKDTVHYLRHLSDRALSAPYAELAEAASFSEIHGPDAIDLALGAPLFDLMPSGSTKLPTDRRGWPPIAGIWELRQAVADTLQSDQGRVSNSGEDVLITSGAAGAFSLALDTFVNPGDRVVLFDPSSPLYSLMLRQRRARIRWISSYMDDGLTRIRFHEVASAMRGARLVVINSPANPTGGMLAAEDLEQIAWWAARRDVLILSDQVFKSYEYDAESTAIETFPTARLRTLIIGSVSKSHALASIRLGWLAGCRELVRPCVATAATQAPFVSTLSQQIALTALRQSPDAFRTIWSDFASRRAYTFERLQALGLNPPWPAGGFFFWVPVRQLGVEGHQFAERLARSKRVLVTPGKLFGPSGNGCVRVSYAMESGRLREGLGRMAEFVRELKGEQTVAKAA